MSLGLHENRQRRRRRFWWGMTKWVVALALVVAAGAWSYHFGSQLAEREVTKAEAEIVQLKQEVAGLQQQSAALAADLAKSRETRKASRSSSAPAFSFWRTSSIISRTKPVGTSRS